MVPSCPKHGRKHIGFACDTEKGIEGRWYCRYGWDLRAYGGKKGNSNPCNWESIKFVKTTKTDKNAHVVEPRCESLGSFCELENIVTQRYFIGYDDCGHEYIVPVERKEEFREWRELESESPQFDQCRMNVNRLTFTDPQGWK